jgi:two-component system response regulator MprA
VRLGAATRDPVCGWLVGIVDTRPVRVLVVDDDPGVGMSVAAALRREGHEVEMAADGLHALDRLGVASYDSVVLDVLMPGLGGLEVCRRLRARGDLTPILMLTARDRVADRVDGLDAGADDYLAKPFAVEELRARLRALLRRVGAASRPVDGPLRFADLELDPVTREVRRGDRLIELTRTEFALLELFMGHARQVLTRAIIFERVWGYDFGPTSNQLWVYISYLRRKLESGGEPRLIHTERGVGYALREPRSG